MVHQQLKLTYLLWVGLLLGCQLVAGGCSHVDEPSLKNDSPKKTTLQKFKFEQKQMGVPFTITLYAKDEATANKAAKAAYERVEKLNDIMSDYNPKSELMLLCASAKLGQPVKVSYDLAEVLITARVLSCKTDGAFDVTVGPMVKDWRRARQRRQLPSKQKIELLKKRVGWRHVSTNPKELTVELEKEKMLLDLGGIAKGYAADEALAVLKKHGITSALIDAGGDVVVGDAPPNKKGWRIGIAALNKPNASPTRFVLLSNLSIATSGDAYQYLEIRGKRYSHIVNPHTGLGLTTRSSVSVIAPTGMKADAWASAVSVLGVKKGIALIEKEDKWSVQEGKCAVLIATIEQDKVKTFSSKKFANFEDK